MTFPFQAVVLYVAVGTGAVDPWIVGNSDELQDLVVKVNSSS